MLGTLKAIYNPKQNRKRYMDGAEKQKKTYIACYRMRIYVTIYAFVFTWLSTLSLR